METRVGSHLNREKEDAESGRKGVERGRGWP